MFKKIASRMSHEPLKAKIGSRIVNSKAELLSGELADDSCTAQHVIGATAADSAQIIVGLREWATSEQFSYSHEWSIGDLVIWDNTGTMHRAEAYDPASGRMMLRTKFESEEPFEYALAPTSFTTACLSPSLGRRVVTGLRFRAAPCEVPLVLSM